MATSKKMKVIRLHAALHDRASECARRAGLSLNKWVSMKVHYACNNDEGKLLPPKTDRERADDFNKE